MPLDLDERQEFVNNCSKLAETVEIMYLSLKAKEKYLPDELIDKLLLAWFSANLHASLMPGIPDFSNLFGKQDDDEESS